ncbi:MAG TPA: hypothetical protein VFF16_11175, partial [Telluria sp.]|nr:hypothetical protein [Telluria sp.]
RLIELVNEDLFQFEDMSAGAIARGLSLQDLCDSLCLEIAQLYLRNEISWDEGDLVMNSLFAWAFNPKNVVGFPKFSWAVYYAFDEAEYVHPNDPPGTNPMLRTAPMLTAALATLSAQPSNPADA